MRVTQHTDGRRANQWHRDVDNNEFILEKALDGDVVITYRGMSCTSFKKLPAEDGIVTGRSYFDHEYFDTHIRPVMEHAGYEVAVPKYEPEQKGSLWTRIKTLITQ